MSIARGGRRRLLVGWLVGASLLGACAGPDEELAEEPSAEPEVTAQNQDLRELDTSSVSVKLEQQGNAFAAAQGVHISVTLTNTGRQAVKMLRWNTPEGGMFLWARLPAGMDAIALLPKAVERGVAFVPGAPFYADTPDPSALRLSFVTATPQQIATGIAALAATIRENLPTPSC